MQTLDDFTFYDYENQKWVSGKHAQDLYIKQLENDLKTLMGPSGIEYAKFLGISRNEAIKNIQAQLNNVRNH